MLKTLTSKFTFFFWLVFLIFNIVVYLFTTIFIKDILQTAEREKIELMMKTLQPNLAMNISFEQKQGISTILDSIIKIENIKSIEITSSLINKKITKPYSDDSDLSSYKTSIVNPFSFSPIANLEILYSNEHLLLIYHKVINAVLFLYIFSIMAFFTFYISIKKELNALNFIAQTLQNYSNKKNFKPIKIKEHTQEINTIVFAVNEMMSLISKHFEELQSFNTKLEKQVKEKVQELQVQEKMLIHQSRQAAMGEMLESIAHQWRQPLNIIGISSANLETEYQLGIMKEATFTQNMQIISTNINYMSSTIDDFRNFLNPDRELSYFDPRKTLEDVLTILKAQLDNNSVELVIDVQTDIVFYGIENEFKQVLFIIINNAKDAIKTKKVLLGKITITFYKEAQMSIVSFCDNGGGIKEDILSSIFNPYFSTKFSSSGTGLGLYMAKNIIESRMDGELKVKNINNGCCFKISQTINNSV
ncbi:MAG: HAMP domain-containing sensor histidine kinase [Campylobacterota bacterium]|nr:HAMP domain-containing sensor histidine kinase [Campylobacterota bacterium]